MLARLLLGYGGAAALAAERTRFQFTEGGYAPSPYAPPPEPTTPVRLRLFLAVPGSPSPTSPFPQRRLTMQARSALTFLRTTNPPREANYTYSRNFGSPFEVRRCLLLRARRHARRAHACSSVSPR